MHLSCLMVALVATTACLSAQNRAGFLHNVAIGATTRGSAGANACQQIGRFDFDDYRSIGVPGPTGNTITGWHFILQDQYATSIETYNVHFYGEDPVNPNFPNLLATQPPGTNALTSVGPFNSPGGAGSPTAWLITSNFATPLVLPNNQDVFMAVEFAASAVNPVTNLPWTDDGLSVQINLGLNPNFPSPTVNTYDLPGPGLIGGGLTNGSYGMSHNLSNSTYGYGGARQYAMDFLVAAPAPRGVMAAITNQLSYPISNTAPGTASFFSGLHPHANVRNDDVSYIYFGAGTGDLVFYLAGFNFQTPALPMSAFAAGATGTVCLDVTNNVVLGFNIASGSGVDARTIQFTPLQRSLIIGLDLVMQGIALNPTTGVLSAAPCGKQRN